MLRSTILGLLAMASLHGPAIAADDAGLWQRLEAGGHVVVMRHAATTPGVGDPPGFRLGDCATQRNLSRGGRAGAQAVGAAFDRRKASVSRVLTSRWCRCVDTARLAFGRAEPAEMLDSVWQQDDATNERRMAAVRRYIAAYSGPGNLILVTHDVNIRAMTGRSVAQGEMVVATAQADGRLDVLGTLAVPAGP